MQQLTYRLRFLTPAFLGNAEQSAQWRTPPIKALLRQWWRVAYRAEHSGASVPAMRNAEGRLFGHAWLENDSDERGHKVAARRSQVRLRLSSWTTGKLLAAKWPGLPKVRHPEVQQAVPADLYLGYGPVTLPRGQRVPALKASAAVQAGESARLSLAAPDDAAAGLLQALDLMNRFGTLGGRSRNGWGSFVLEPESGTAALEAALDTRCLRPWSDALETDWPHAIGNDHRGALIWQTGQAESDWTGVIRSLAQIKIGLRTQFRFPQEKADGEAHDRHWLSYPVTNHKVNDWNNLRLPNSLRFKVRTDHDGKLRGVIFHMPCLPPRAFRPDAAAIQAVWKKVHDYLDAAPALQRIPG